MARPQGALFTVNMLEKAGLKNKIGEARSYLRWRRKYASRLHQFKDKHAGQDCFIIGNGPSLNKMDLSPLADYHTFGLNKIYMIFEKVDLNLSYLVSTNALVIEQAATRVRRTTFPAFPFLYCFEWGSGG